VKVLLLAWVLEQVECFDFFSERLVLHLNGNHFKLPNISVQAALPSEKHFMPYILKKSV